jgi:hypothetical protein
MARLMGYRKPLFEGVGFVAALIAIGGAASWLAGAIWPVGLVAAESIALVAALGWIYFSRRAVSRSQADQKLLDELLSLLSRPSLQRIEENDFAEAWRRSIMYPVLVFVEEYGDVEYQFDDNYLEARRTDLYNAARSFLHEEAINAVALHGDISQRYVGLTGGEVEGNEELLEKFEAKHLAIFGPSRDFLSAHTELVVLAKKRRYDVTALAGKGAPHPTVQRFEARDSERRASTISDPRAKW